MATKKKKSSAEESATQARPYMLVIVVILAGVVSTWFWYKPLTQESPSESVAIVSPVQVAPSHSTLIEPNTNNVGAVNATAVPVYSALPEVLVGDRQVELKPFQPIGQGTLKERLAKEPLPVVPISRPEHARIEAKAAMAAARPPLWTDMDNPTAGDSASRFGQALASQSGAKVSGTSSTSSAWEATSPWTASAGNPTQPNSKLVGDRIVAISNPPPSANGQLAPARGWPDSGFNPDSVAANGAQKPVAPVNPPLWVQASDVPGVNQSGSRQPGKIALADSANEETMTAQSDDRMQRKSFPTSLSSGSSEPRNQTANTQNANTQNTLAKKSGAVIRQPKQ